MPGILFLCIHNAGRSQMAAGFAREIGAGRVDIYSGGSEPADTVNPVAVGAMAEVGIDLSECRPRLLSPDEVRESDVVITMGCGDACPVYPGKTYLDWELDDPAGQGLEAVRLIRDEIAEMVGQLVRELSLAPPAAGSS